MSDFVRGVSDDVERSDGEVATVDSFEEAEYGGGIQPFACIEA